MIKCARIPRIIIICGFVMMFVSFILLFILPCFGITMRYITNVTDPGKPLPLQTYYPYDTDMSPYFELTFLAQGVTLMVSAIGYSAIDSLFGLLVFHVCGQLENLKSQLMDKKVSNFDRVLADAVTEHVRLIRCVKVIESTFTLMLLGLFLYFGILFSLYGFLLVTVITNGLHLSLVRLLYLIIVVTNIFGHMCLYCTVGEFLITRCEGVYRAACDYRLYKLEPKQARNLILLMLYTSKPLYVTVGKIFPLTMDTFCSSGKNSSSHVLVFDMDISRSLGYRDFVWAIELHRFGLELIGLWPKTEEATANKSHGSNIRVSLVFTVILVSGVPFIWALVRVWGDMILMIDNLRITLPLIVVSMKYVIMRWKRTVLLSIVNMMAEDWTALKLAAERDVMIRRARIARFFIIFGYIIMVLAFIMLIVFPCFGIYIRHLTNLTDRNKPLPLQTYYFYDTDQSPLFELTFLVQALTLSLAAIVYTSVDAFLGLIILHICGQLENFRRRMVNLVSCKDFNHALSNGVLVHLRLIRFAENIENTFTLMMFGLLLYFGIVFCLCGFLLLTVVTDKKISNAGLPQVCYMAVAALILLSHTFLYCGAGELIAQQCNAVYHAICDLEWYKLEPKKARTLIILMLRTNEPFRFTAGKIIPLTMTTFCSLLKTSASYISFLLAKRS
ncbi:uncharacterized protein [Anoplolepis gracilipes]|uniref:uncharacterized protein n=1 Tax=Anoplolepis gracilipes TaxID=354296 RepID=UPI003BA34A16